MSTLNGVFLLSLPVLLSLTFSSAQEVKSAGTSLLEESKPKITGLVGLVDQTALAEIKAHRTLVAPSGWTGFQGTGKINYGSDSTTFEATLSTTGSGSYRLDTQSKAGLTSFRIDHYIAKEQEVGGELVVLPVEAAAAGIFPFELARTFTSGNRAASLRDAGSVNVAGNSLHKISLERSTLGMNPATKLPETATIDLYFDPTTHLLVETVAMVPAPGSRNLFLQTMVKYGDYRRVGTSLVPFRFTEYIEGELSRTLQLTEVRIAPALGESFFRF